MSVLQQHLPEKERQLLAIMQERGCIVTRLKERSIGDVELVQPSVTATAGGGESGPPTLADDDVLTCLHALEGRSLVVSRIQVSRESTNEYVCEWTLI